MNFVVSGSDFMTNCSSVGDCHCFECHLLQGRLLVPVFVCSGSLLCKIVFQGQVAPSLVAFATLRKETVSFLTSVLPRETTRLPLDGFSWNLICEPFSKICRETFTFHLKSDKNNKSRKWVIPVVCAINMGGMQSNTTTSKRCILIK